MRRAVSADEWRARWRAAHDEVDAAYWRFTRCRRAPPPPLACPDAFARQAAAERALRFLGEKVPF